MRSRLILLYVIIIVSIPFLCMLYNGKVASDAKATISQIPVPKNAKVVESISVSGRLKSSSKEVQSFGAILIKSSGETVESLDAYYGRNSDIDVRKQEGAQIKQITAKKVEFKNYEEGEDMYIVYLWGKPSYKILKKLDARAIISVFDKDFIRKLTKIS